jgi:hypothetical protein
MDEYTRVILNDLAIQQVVPVPLHSIEEGDEKLLAARANRTVVEYLWTLTPTIILRLLERNAEIDILTYVDADMLFYRNSSEMFQELGSNSVLIHEHRFPKMLAHLEDFGRFNVGILVFRRDDGARAVLRWWRDRCIEWCKATLEAGRYGDQKYLDRWPELFEGVLITRDIGIGVAPWNHCQYLFAERNNSVYINDIPLTIYHFHSFQILNEAAMVPVGIAEYLTPMSYFHTALPRYLTEIRASIDQVRSVDPGFTFGLQRSDFNLTPEISFIIRTDALPQLDASVKSLPHQPISPDWVLFPGSRIL